MSNETGWSSAAAKPQKIDPETADSGPPPSRIVNIFDAICHPIETCKTFCITTGLLEKSGQVGQEMHEAAMKKTDLVQGEEQHVPEDKGPGGVQ